MSEGMKNSRKVIAMKRLQIIKLSIINIFHVLSLKQQINSNVRDNFNNITYLKEC
jgi:hypothetical protein